MKKTGLKITAILCLALAAALCGCQEPEPEPKPNPKPNPPLYEVPNAPNAPTDLRVLWLGVQEVVSGYDPFDWGVIYFEGDGYGYNLYRSDSPEGPYEKVDENTGHSFFTVQGLEPKKPYYFKVSAYKVNFNNFEHIEGELSEYFEIIMPDLRHPPHGVIVTLEDSDTSARIEWDAAYDDVEYNVYRTYRPVGTTSEPFYPTGNRSEPFYLVGTTSELFYEDTELVFGAGYMYTVATVTDDGRGPFSPVVSVKTRLAIPVIDAQLLYSDSGAGVHISWEPLSGASSYNVYRGDGANGTYIIKAEKLSNTQTQYMDIGFDRNVFNYYKVSASYPGGESEKSDHAVIFLRGAPKGVKGRFVPFDTTMPSDNLGFDYIKIDWDEYPNAAAEFRLYRRTHTDDDYILVETLSTNTYNDADITRNISYNYKVAAVVNGDEGEPSSLVIAAKPPVPIPPPLPAPANVKVSLNIFLLTYTISWSPVEGANRYYVYRNGVQIGETGLFFYIDFLRLDERSATYAVKAVAD